MIKAKLTLIDGRPAYLFGLSTKNIEKLQQRMPIRIALEDMGGAGEVYIMWGDTEDAIARELHELIGPDTVVTGVPKS